MTAVDLRILARYRGPGGERQIVRLVSTHVGADVAYRVAGEAFDRWCSAAEFVAWTTGEVGGTASVAQEALWAGR